MTSAPTVTRPDYTPVAPTELSALPDSLLNRELKSIDQGSFRLADFSGKVIVVNLDRRPHRAQLAVFKEVHRIRPSGAAQRAQHLASEWGLRFERALADWARWARLRVEEGFLNVPD